MTEKLQGGGKLRLCGVTAFCTSRILHQKGAMEA